MSRVALVTGAAQGIGAEVASRLARDGYTVAGLDIRPGTGVSHECDVRDWDAVGAVVERVESDLGPIEAVASVAGVYEHVPFLELDPRTWHRILDVNLEGTFNVCRQAAARMAERRRGAIVCIASNAAFLAWVGGAHYSASKAGVVGLVKGMALELGPVGIRANAVCPGTVRTPASALDLSDPETEAVQVAACPVGRIGEPPDIAEAVAFLLDPERAAWISGEALLVDGGFGTHGQGATFGSVSNSVVG